MRCSKNGTASRLILFASTKLGGWEDGGESRLGEKDDIGMSKSGAPCNSYRGQVFQRYGPVLIIIIIQENASGMKLILEHSRAEQSKQRSEVNRHTEERNLTRNAKPLTDTDSAFPCARDTLVRVQWHEDKSET